MKIYDIEGFPNPVRVRIALAEKGATDKVEFVPVDVMGGEHRTEAFKAMNPDAVVLTARTLRSVMRLQNISTATLRARP